MVKKIENIGRNINIQREKFEERWGKVIKKTITFNPFLFKNRLERVYTIMHNTHAKKCNCEHLKTGQKGKKK